LKYRLLDLLACPICKHFPLKLFLFSEKTLEEAKTPPNVCELYCGLEEKMLSEMAGKPNCEKCYGREIVDALLLCTQCNRWYPVIEEIPHMLPDSLREREEDLSFLRRWKEKIPEDILLNGKPFNLKET